MIFARFLDAAHERGLQVMIELVVNHTSDQHPWFQAARLAPRGFAGTRLLCVERHRRKNTKAFASFLRTRKDPIGPGIRSRKQYFWHRFFSHQPDLNFDNPHVIEEILKVMRFWLDMGVDALRHRCDSLSCRARRNLLARICPKRTRSIKTLRREIDANYSDRMMLAEANQWPTDVRPYFGDGDECHMAFHFPLMPRIYMALRQEDRLPITDIIAQTPSIPDSCQWGLFLRNHDELTLEMVTNDERDYMYLAYSADPRMRMNLGIRRRLAPLGR